jgi:hypothetical protein
MIANTDIVSCAIGGNTALEGFQDTWLRYFGEESHSSPPISSMHGSFTSEEPIELWCRVPSLIARRIESRACNSILFERYDGRNFRNEFIQPT